MDARERTQTAATALRREALAPVEERKGKTIASTPPDDEPFGHGPWGCGFRHQTPRRDDDEAAQGRFGGPQNAEHGAVKILTHDAAEYADYLVVPKVDALQAAHEAVSPAAVLVPSSAEGKEIAARLALRIGSGIITDAVDLEAGDEGPVATQPVFAASFTTSCIETRRKRETPGSARLTTKGSKETSPRLGAGSAWAALSAAAGFCRNQ